MAGRDWLHGYFKRHPDISLRMPKNNSVARASGFNKRAVMKFFDIIEPIIKETTVSSKSNYVVTRKKKQVRCLTAVEKGELITGEILIFSRVREDPK